MDGSFVSSLPRKVCLDDIAPIDTGFLRQRILEDFQDKRPALFLNVEPLV